MPPEDTLTLIVRLILKSVNLDYGLLLQRPKYFDLVAFTLNYDLLRKILVETKSLEPLGIGIKEIIRDRNKGNMSSDKTSFLVTRI
jgi:hypothetical protein